MRMLDREFLERMKEELDTELIGVASLEISDSTELKERATSLLPGAKSVLVLAKETLEEV
jgi:hypothetical protein